MFLDGNYPSTIMRIPPLKYSDKPSAPAMHRESYEKYILYGCRWLMLATITILLANCSVKKMVDPSFRGAEEFWKERNEKLLAIEGRRVVQVPPHEVMFAVQDTIIELGMEIEDQAFADGFLLAAAPAPAPLTEVEWSIAQQRDIGEMRSAEHRRIDAAPGEPASSGLDIFVYTRLIAENDMEVLASVLVRETDGGTEVSVDLRLRNEKLRIRDRPRLLQPTSTVLQHGLEKFWRTFEGELGLQLAYPTKPPVAPSPFSILPKTSPRDMAYVVRREPTVQDTQPEKIDWLLAGGLVTRKGAKNPDGIAVIIGNRSYGHGIPEVPYAHNDAAAMRRFIISTLGFREANIIDLRDASIFDLQKVFGDERNHRGKLWRWVRPTVSDVVVYYSGHGVPRSADRHSYLLPVDFDPAGGGYALGTLYSNLSSVEARSVTVFLEAGFSGGSQGGIILKNISQRTNPIAPDPQLTVLAAASKNQVAHWDNEARLGLFTRYLLDGLHGAADSSNHGYRDRRVTTREIGNFLDHKLPYQARRRFGQEQNATVRGNMDAVLADYN